MKGIIIHNHEISRYWVEQLRGTGLDVLALHPTGGKTATGSLERLLEQIKTDEFLRFKEQIEGLGMTLEYEMHHSTPI